MFKILTPDYNKIETNRLIIWQFPTNVAFPEATRYLSAAEKERAQRFYYDYHRIRYTVSHALTRAILAQYANISPEKLIFSQHKYGKPYLENAPQIEFNLTHSKDLALLAIGQSHPVGIDIEYFKARGYQGISEMMYSHNEQRLVENAVSNIKPLIFFKIWSQKEAVIKADGRGIFNDTRRFDVNISKNDYDLCAFGEDWKMKTFTPSMLYFAAICHKRAVNEFYYKKLTPDFSTFNYDAIFKFK